MWRLQFLQARFHSDCGLDAHAVGRGIVLCGRGFQNYQTCPGCFDVTCLRRSVGCRCRVVTGVAWCQKSCVAALQPGAELCHAVPTPPNNVKWLLPSLYAHTSPLKGRAWTQTTISPPPVLVGCAGCVYARERERERGRASCGSTAWSPERQQTRRSNHAHSENATNDFLQRVAGKPTHRLIVIAVM